MYQNLCSCSTFQSALKDLAWTRLRRDLFLKVAYLPKYSNNNTIWSLLEKYIHNISIGSWDLGRCNQCVFGSLTSSSSVAEKCNWSVMLGRSVQTVLQAWHFWTQFWYVLYQFCWKFCEIFKETNANYIENNANYIAKCIAHNAVCIAHNAVCIAHNAVCIAHNAVCIVFNAVCIKIMETALVLMHFAL